MQLRLPLSTWILKAHMLSRDVELRPLQSCVPAWTATPPNSKERWSCLHASIIHGLLYNSQEFTSRSIVDFLALGEILWVGRQLKSFWTGTRNTLKQSPLAYTGTSKDSPYEIRPERWVRLYIQRSATKVTFNPTRKRFKLESRCIYI